MKALGNVVLVLSMPIFIIAMEKPKKEIEVTQVDKNTVLAKEIVLDFLIRNSDILIKQIHNPYHTEGERAKKLYFEQEIATSATHICSDKAIVCADNKIMLVDLLTNKMIKSLPIKPSKIDDADLRMPAITAICCAKLWGEDQEQIILGENNGGVLIANPSLNTDHVKRFGEVGGRVHSFVCHPQGTHIALKYAQKNEAGLIVPCLAVSAAYPKSKTVELTDSKKSGSYLVAQERIKKRRSWLPAHDWGWSDFVTQPCEHEIETIHFEGEQCVTKCSFTQKIEKWVVEKPEGNAKLKKVE
jgi:hypothetical protein